MKLSDLERVVEKAGLEMQVERSGQENIAQIWWPYKPSGIVLDGKIYDNLTLTRADVERINEAFLDVAKWCAFDASLQVKDYYYIEFNAISSMNVILRGGKDRLLSRTEIKTDFELDETSHRANRPYEIDMKAGYQLIDMFKNVSLKKHEKEKVLGNLQNLFMDNNIHGIQQIVTNLARYSNWVEPLEFALKSNWLDLSFVIEQLLNDDWVYYESQNQAKKLLKLLSTYKSTMQIDLSQGRGSLPEVIIESPSMMKNVSVNWKFIPRTEKRVFTMLIQDEQLKALKIFMNNYPAFVSDSFSDITEQFLIIVHDKKMVKEFLDNWVELNNQYADFIDELDTFVVRTYSENLKLAVEKVYGPNPQHLFSALVDAFSQSNAYSELENARILEIFIDNPEVDLTYGNAYIIKVFNKDKKMKDKLLQVPGMMEIVVATGDTDLIPDDIQEMFMF